MSTLKTIEEIQSLMNEKDKKPEEVMILLQFEILKRLDIVIGFSSSGAHPNRYHIRTT